MIMSDAVVDQNKTDETTDWDDVSFLDEMELGEVDPESYQEQGDDGCEGGACKIWSLNAIDKADMAPAYKSRCSIIIS